MRKRTSEMALGEMGRVPHGLGAGRRLPVPVSLRQHRPPVANMLVGLLSKSAGRGEIPQDLVITLSRTDAGLLLDQRFSFLDMHPSHPQWLVKHRLLIAEPRAEFLALVGLRTAF